MRRGAAAVGALCLAFLGLYGSLAGRLGVCDAHIGLPALRILKGLEFPLSYSYRHGPLDFYLTVPFLAIFGPVPAALFCREAVFASLAIAGTSGLAWLLYGELGSALLAGLMLAFCPGFLVLSLIGGGTALSGLALGVSGTGLLLLSARRRSAGLACLGFAALGCALACRSPLAALMAGLLACAWVHRADVLDSLPRRRRERRVLFACCAASFLIFLLPLALFSLRHGAELNQWVDHLVVRESGETNLNYLSGINFRIHQLAALLDGRAFLDIFVEKPFGAWGQPWLFALALGAAAVLLPWKRPLSRGWAVPWLICGVYFALSPFSPTLLRRGHLFPMLPYLCVAASSVAAKLRGRWALAVLLGLGLTAISADLLFFRRLRSELDRTGGYGPEVSRATVDLFHWLSRRPRARAVLVGDGPDDALAFLSGGALPVEVVPGEPEILGGGFDAVWERLLKDDRSFFVASALPDASRFSLAALKRQAGLRGRALLLDDEIRRPDGRPVFRVFKAGYLP